MITRHCVLVIGLVSVVNGGIIDRLQTETDQSYTIDPFYLKSPMTDKDEFAEPLCTDWMLQVTMENSMTNDTEESEESIRRAAEAVLETRLDVVCAKGELSYATYTRTFCKVSDGEMTCYAFEPLQ
ncbi:hypothetical protein Tcan_08554 [Toxocara canis]|uniref:Ground-like domain-containing protein n=2 Tax=Toxocara canis TaxID=6265 RepID=A0A0B2VDD2_TOXCA|nr:hypothetical protein Tcan_08554 [Toxocara canis]VDM43498.1 unnamed protein product [Toxocara canis]